jgi:hypothetical protein
MHHPRQQTPSKLTKVDDKLNDLETSNPFLPPNANAPCALEVIPVHNDMYHEVEGNRNPRDRSKAN